MTRSIFACALVLLLASAAATAQFRTVTVENSNSNPVPTNIQSMPPVTVSGTVEAAINNTPGVTIANTPSVNIANTPSVNATITGTPSVSVTGTPTVSVSNLPTGTSGRTPTTGVLVKSLDNPAGQPIQIQTECLTADAHSNVCGATINVPPGKVFVLEYLQFLSVVVANGSNPQYYSLQTTTTGGSAQYAYALGTLVTPGFFTSEHLVRIYADPGSKILLTGFADSVVGNVRFTFMLSGHLVDVP
jgi:hypothetical protein